MNICIDKLLNLKKKLRYILGHRAIPRISSPGIALVFVMGFLIIPFFVYPYGIAQDYPNHYAAYSVAFQKLQGGVSPSFYEIQWRLFPHLTMAILAAPVALGVSIPLAFHIFLIASVIMPVIGGCVLQCHIHGKISWTSLILLAFVYNISIYFGFFDFNFSLGLVFLLYTIFLRQTQNFTIGGYLLLNFGSALLFLCHLLGFLIFGLIISSHLFYIICKRQSLRGRLTVFISPLFWLWPTGILVALWISLGPKSLPHETFEIGLPQSIMVFSGFIRPFFFGQAWPTVLFSILFLTILPYAIYTGAMRMKRENAVVCVTLIIATILLSQRVGGVVLDFRLGIVTFLYAVSVVKICDLNNPKKKIVVIFSAVLLFCGLLLQGFNAWQLMKMTNNEVSAIRDAIQKIPLKSTLIAASSSDSRPFLHAGSFIVSDRDGFFPLLFQVVQPLYARSAFASINLPGAEMSGRRLTANATKPPCKAQNNDWFNLKFDHGWPLNFDYLIWFSSSAETMKEFVFLNKVAEGKHFHLYEIDKQKAIYFFQKSNEGEKDCLIVGE